uniref:Uncharacterized protein n=1 Tax=Mycena chlorophos TaxID=658473 RepID=A0ABQ0L8Y9_MYCCL|nr:predicted protein [Mycena chlorophos]
MGMWVNHVSEARVQELLADCVPCFVVTRVPQDLVDGVRKTNSIHPSFMTNTESLLDIDNVYQKDARLSRVQPLTTLTERPKLRTPPTITGNLGSYSHHVTACPARHRLDDRSLTLTEYPTVHCPLSDAQDTAQT